MNVKILTPRAQYDPYAEMYSESFLKFNQQSIRAYFGYFDMDLAGKRLLDLGCGTGYDLSQFKSQGALIHGIDGSEEMVKLATDRNPEAQIEIGSFDQIPFPDQHFDFVVSKWALQTTEFIDPVYSEVIRVLKPGGKFIYLACHPIRQFLEKKRKGKDYFKKETVESTFFDGQVTALEPSHTFNEYFSQMFLNILNWRHLKKGLIQPQNK